MSKNICFYLIHSIGLGLFCLTLYQVPHSRPSLCPQIRPVIIHSPNDDVAILQLSADVKTIGQELRALQSHLPQKGQRRDPFFHPSLFTFHNSSPSSSMAPKLPVLPQPAVAVEELSEEPVNLDESSIKLRPQVEKQISPSIELDGYRFSLTGLTGQQELLLRTIAKIPTMPTEEIRGLRYVRVGTKKYLDDCSNVLRIAYDELGIDLFSERYHYPKANGVRLIRMKGYTKSASTSSTSVAVGDLVIFDNTYDRNKNKRLDDRDTHAAIVVGFEGAHTAVIYHRVRSGHKIGRMNLRQKHKFFSREGDQRINDVLRRVSRKNRHKVPRLTGQLFATYVRVIPPETMPLSYLSK